MQSVLVPVLKMDDLMGVKSVIVSVIFCLATSLYSEDVQATNTPTRWTSFTETVRKNPFSILSGGVITACVTLSVAALFYKALHRLPNVPNIPWPASR